MNEDNLQNRVEQNIVYSSDKPIILDYAPNAKISRIEKIIILAAVLGGALVMVAVLCYPVLKYISDSYFAKRIEKFIPWYLL